LKERERKMKDNNKREKRNKRNRKKERGSNIT